MRLAHPTRVAKKTNWRSSLLKIVCLLCGAYLVWSTSQALLPICICFIIALMLDGLLTKWQKFGITRLIGSTIIASLMILVVVFLVLGLAPMLVSQLSGFMDSIPRYSNEIQVVLIPYAERFMDRHHVLLSRMHLPTDFQVIIDQASTYTSNTLKNIAGNIFVYLSRAASFSLWLIIGPIITIFALGDMPYIRRRIHQMLPSRHSSTIVHMIGAIGKVWTGYMKGMFTVSLIYGIIIACIAALLGVSYPLVIGCMTAILYLVPYIGFITAAIVAGTLAYLTPAHEVLWAFHVADRSPGFTLTMVLTLFLMNFTFDQAITPRIAGESAGLRPFASVVAMILGASLLGVWGMIIAIPVAASGWILLTTLFPNLAAPVSERKSLKSQALRKSKAKPVLR
ncbi:MAG: AI-2E family transporter [Armatimonadota bacterium]